MSTIERPDRRVLPPLVAGQRLDQPTFHDRYAAMPPETRAELIGGVVHMPSPLSRDHGFASENVSGWLFHYRRKTLKIEAAADATTKLGVYGEPQPDRQMWIPEELGGQVRIVDRYITGAPELIVEIARSSLALDLGPKKADYERAGVLEYLVIALDPDDIYWHVRRDGRFVRLEPGADGWYRSEVFPGLWLDPTAFFTEDLDRLVDVVEQGLATPEHAAFVARLAAAKARQ